MPKGGGGGGGNQTTTTTQQQPNPAVQAAYNQLTGAAFNQASQPLNQYTGSLVAGFTPQQQQAFQSVQNAQGIGTPFTNAAAQQISSATAPLWPSLPQYDVSGLPQGAMNAINTAQQYGAAAAQPIASSIYPYTEIAAGAAQNLTSNAYPYAALATQPVNTSPYTSFAQGTAQNLPGQVSPYTSFAQGTAQNLPGQVSPYAGFAQSTAQGLQGQASPYASQAAQAGANIYGQISPYTGLAGQAAANLPGTAAQGAGIAYNAAQGLNVNPAVQAALSPLNVPGYNVDPYLSPYTKNVTDALQNLFNQQNAQQQAQVAGSTVGAGAYGGDRQAVAQALVAQQQQLAQAPVLAQVQQQGFQQAQQEQNTEQQLALQRAISQGQLGLGAAGALTQAAGTRGQLGLGAGQLQTQAQQAAGQLGLGTAGALTQAGATAGQLGLGAGQLLTQAGTAAGQLGLGAGQLTTQAGLGAGQLGLGAGQLTSQTGLGAGQLGLGAGQLYTQGALGQGQLGLGAGNLITQAGAQQGQLGLGAGQLTAQALAQQGQLGLGAGQLNLAAGQQLQGNFNQQQQTQLAAEQANAWLASQAGYGLGALGTQAQQQALSGAQALLGTGTLQQQLAQEQLNIPYEQFLAQQAYPYQQLNFLSPIVEGTGSLGGGTASTTQPGPSTLGQLAGLGVAGVGAAGLLNQTGAFNNLFGSSNDPTSAFDAAQAAGQTTTADFASLLARGGRVGFAGGGSPIMLTDTVPKVSIDYVEPDPHLPSTILPQGITSQTTTGAGKSSGGGGGIAGDIGVASGLLNIGKFAAGLLLADGGRVGLADGGFGVDSHIPTVPKLSLDYIVPGQPVKGIGLPHPPSPSPQDQSGSPQALAADMKMAGDAIKGFGKDTAPEEAASGGLVGMPHVGGMGGLSGLGGIKTSMSHVGGFGEHPRLQAGGGFDQPLTAAAPLEGVSPNTQTAYLQYEQLPLEQLEELSLRVPSESHQGQLIQRALQAKRLNVGSGTPSAQQQTPQPAAPSSYLPLQPPSTISNPNAGLARGGEAEPDFVTEDEIDQSPVVDHTGDTVVIHYPSEKKSIDLGLPSMARYGKSFDGAGGQGLGSSERLSRAGGGPTRTLDTTNTLDNLMTQYNALSPELQATYNGVVGSNQGVYNTPDLTNKLELANVLSGYSALSPTQRASYDAAVSSANNAGAGDFSNATPMGLQDKLNLEAGLGGWTWASPAAAAPPAAAPPASAPAPPPGGPGTTQQTPAQQAQAQATTPAQQSVLQNALVGAPSENLGFSVPRPQPTNPFANIMAPPPINVGKATIPQPRIYPDIPVPKITTDFAAYDPNNFGGSGGGWGGWNNPLPQLPIPGLGGENNTTYSLPVSPALQNISAFHFRRGGRTGFDEGGDTDDGVSQATLQMLREHGTEPVLPPPATEDRLAPGPDYRPVSRDEAGLGTREMLREHETEVRPQFERAVPGLPLLFGETPDKTAQQQAASRSTPVAPSPHSASAPAMRLTDTTRFPAVPPATPTPPLSPNPETDEDRAFRTLMALRGQPIGPGLAAAPNDTSGVTEDPARTVGTSMLPRGLGAPNDTSGVTEDPARTVGTSMLPRGLGAHPTSVSRETPETPHVLTPPTAALTPPAYHGAADTVARSPASALASPSLAYQPDGLPVHPEVHKYFRQTGLPAELEPVLSRIVSGEAQRPNEIYGGGTFQDYSHHPNIAVPITSGPHAGESSTAAGLPQFLKTTWDQEATKPGVVDPSIPEFHPVNQLRGAADLAQTEYRKNTGRDLLDDARAGNVNYTALAGQWPSLNSGQYSGEYEDVLRGRARAPGVFGGGLGAQPPSSAGAGLGGTGEPARGVGTGLGGASGGDPMQAIRERMPPEEASRSDWTSSPWFSVIAAGLGIMASPAHFPLQQIGQGGLQGIKAAENIAGRDLRERQLANEAANRQATLGLEAARLRQTGDIETARLQQTDKHTTAQIAEASRYHDIEQQHWAQQMEAENQRFQIQEKNAQTNQEKANNLAKHQQNTDAINAGYREYLMSRPQPWYNSKTGETGSATFDPNVGSFNIPEGATIGKPPTGSSLRFDHMKAAYLSVHPGDDQGALDYAAGRKSMSEQEMIRSAETQAANEIKQITNPANMLGPMYEQWQKMTPQQKDEYTKGRTQFWAQQIRGGFSGLDPAAPAPAATATAAPAAAPATPDIPARPPNVPEGSAYSLSRKMWRSPDGQIFDAKGGQVSPAS